MARGRGRVLEGEEEVVCACRALGEGSNNSSKGWKGVVGVDGSASRKGKSVKGEGIARVGEGGRGRDGLNVIHGRDRLLSVSYRCLSCEVHFFVSFSDWFILFTMKC